MITFDARRSLRPVNLAKKNGVALFLKNMYIGKKS